MCTHRRRRERSRQHAPTTSSQPRPAPLPPAPRKAQRRPRADGSTCPPLLRQASVPPRQPAPPVASSLAPLCSSTAPGLRSVPGTCASDAHPPRPMRCLQLLHARLRPRSRMRTPPSSRRRNARAHSASPGRPVRPRSAPHLAARVPCISVVRASPCGPKFARRAPLLQLRPTDPRCTRRPPCSRCSSASAGSRTGQLPQPVRPAPALAGFPQPGRLAPSLAGFPQPGPLALALAGFPQPGPPALPRAAFPATRPPTSAASRSCRLLMQRKEWPATQGAR